MFTIISSHNKHLLAESNTAIEEKCNCRKKETCPLLGKCQTKGVVYQATIKYVGITESAFKTRYNNHTNSFRNPKHKNSTALSKCIWKRKDSKIIKNCRGYSSHTKNCRGYSSHTKKCSLCLDEKYIICHLKLSLLNSRNELVSTCRLRKKISSFLGIIIRRDNHHRKQICSD